MTLAPSIERGLSKAAAIALLLGAVWLVSAIIVEPLLSRLTDAREQIAQERDLLGRLLAEARAVSTRPVEEAEAEPVFLQGESGAERIAALQSRIETVAAAAGVRLSSLQPMAEQTEGRLRLIGLRAIATGSIEQVQRFFHAVEDGRPALIIRSLDMATSARGPDANGDLDFRISITGAVASDAAVRP